MVAPGLSLQLPLSIPHNALPLTTSLGEIGSSLARVPMRVSVAVDVSVVGRKVRGTVADRVPLSATAESAPPPGSGGWQGYELSAGP